MVRVYRLLLVLVIISLVIMGLNISNQGISRLTTEDRGQVIGLDFNNNAVELQVFSKDYVYTSEKFRNEQADIVAQLQHWGEQTKNYLSKAWRIFKAIV